MNWTNLKLMFWIRSTKDLKYLRKLRAGSPAATTWPLSLARETVNRFLLSKLLRKKMSRRSKKDKE